MAPPLELWFDFASTYSYLAVMRVEDAARAAGLEVAWRPFLLGPLFTEQLGIRDSPFNAFPVRGRYMWRDLERLCARYGLPWRRPSVFPRSSVRAARIALVADAEGWAAPFARAAAGANFAEDREVGDPEVLAAIVAALGHDPARVLAAAEEPGTKALLRARTDEARALGMFGAPDFVVAGELFFGHDRMEDAIAWARAAAEPGSGAARP